MIIKDIFTKPIDRDIKGVIKVGQAEEENIKQELEEYVVTRELKRHFAEFFASYKRGIVGATDKMGVWISGFFGSGKSHFLKILSYLIENRVVDGKPALDYFIDDNKITDPAVLADMQLAADTSTDVILFNVDSKGSSTGKQDKDAILNVFLKVFNEMQGFCGVYPQVAELERRLSEEGRYDDFRSTFAELTGEIWEEERYGVDFIQDDIVDTLVKIDFMSEEAAWNWCSKATDPYAISIEAFAKLIKSYIDSKGNNHHLVFLVDEIGQYIGDNSQLMLNLQTVTEDLGTACFGKVWVVVTSQQDIDSITKIKGNDFSKIQGRFDTRLSLSSANVDEVIRKRILEKTEPARQALSVLYEEKETIIKNLIIFNDGIEKKLYSDSENFAEVYPFIPYQFNLLGSVLTAIRTYGASGKHLADGERSMLALFQESAVSLMQQNIGALVSFNMFYEALEEFIDHSHKGVILKALDNTHLNPDKADRCFDVEVLKTLFMIKYVKEIEPNAENITTLMVPYLDVDRHALYLQVEEALKRLTHQTLVQMNGDRYIFLTSEEQEVNRSINNQNIESGEVKVKVSELIFEDLFDAKRYRHPGYGGRYSFGFNQYIDDSPYKTRNNNYITLEVLTTESDFHDNEQAIRMHAGQSGRVVVVLPDDRSFIEELSTALKIEKYIRQDTLSSINKYEQIKLTKREELREHNQRARFYLQEALKNADIYVKNDKISLSSQDITTRIMEAIGKLVESIFNKLHYISDPVNEDDIKALFQEQPEQMSIDGASYDINHLALEDVKNYIKSQHELHIKTSMKTLMDRFQQPPYGFLEVDIQWIVAKLFVNGDITLEINREPVTRNTKSSKEIIHFLTRKEYINNLMVDFYQRANAKQKKNVKIILQDVFNVSFVKDDDEAIMNEFTRQSSKMLLDIDQLEINYQLNPKYPGRPILDKMKSLLENAKSKVYAKEFFEYVDNHFDEFLDQEEELQYVESFFAGEQKNIFDDAVRFMDIIDNSKSLIMDKDINQIASEINEILGMSAPYGNIHVLKTLTIKLREQFTELLEQKAKPIREAIEGAKLRVLGELENKSFKDEMIKRVHQTFSELDSRAAHTNSLSELYGLERAADDRKVFFLNEIKNLEVNKKQIAELKRGNQTPQDQELIPQLSKQIQVISIKSILPEKTWQLENENDIEKYLASLRDELKKKLQEDVILNVEF